MRYLKNIKLFLNYVIGPILICVLAYSIYHKLNNKQQSGQSFKNLFNSLGLESLWILGLILFLMLMNWGLEAFKWKLTLRNHQNVSFIRAFKSVLAGTSFGFFTPNRVGEYVGRVLVLQPGNRVNSISLTLICSMAQLLVTLLTGIAGLLWMNHSGVIFTVTQRLTGELLLYVGILSVTLLLVLYARLEVWIKWLERKPLLAKVKPYFQALCSIETKVLFYVLFLSILRYLVFIIQYGLAFKIFKIYLSPEQVFGSVSVVFMIVAVLPSLAQIAELGIRWEASMGIVGLFSANSVGVFSASFTIWVINLVLPAVIGMVFLWKIRFFREE
jgi:hypothetical protein